MAKNLRTNQADPKIVVLLKKIKCIQKMIFYLTGAATNDFQKLRMLRRSWVFVLRTASYCKAGKRCDAFVGGIQGASGDAFQGSEVFGL